MVSGDSGSLTRIGFRRDVKLFLAALVGYLIVVILALLLAMQNSVLTFVASTEEVWLRQADTLGREIDRLDSMSIQPIQDLINERRAAMGAIGIEVSIDEGQLLESGITPTGVGRVVERPLTRGRLRVLFDDTVIRHERRRLTTIAAVSFVSAVATAVLLMLYIPRILRPVEEMLEHASEIERQEGTDEAQFVVSAFRRTIDTLKAQKSELERLHEREKTRADELERISSTLKRSMVSGLIATDPEGRLVDMNTPARKILSIGEPDVEGRPITEILSPGEFTDCLTDTLQTRSSVERREASYTAGESSIPLGVTTVPLLSDEDAFLGVLAVFTDLTEVRSLERQVREMQTLADLGEIAAGIAHEFRNSLSTIVGNLRLLERSNPPSNLSPRISAAKTEADLLAGAVDSLMAFARPIEPERKQVDIHDLVSTLTERFAGEAADVAFEVSGSAAYVVGDPTLLRVAFENILRNAIDAVRASGRKGSVEVEIRQGAEVEVSVCDNGIGLDPGDAARYMLPFQSGKSSGFGLGLAMTKRIVVSHGGRIVLTGLPGQGATVSVALPSTPCGP